MKRIHRTIVPLIAIVLTVLSTTSCTSVYFDQPQSAGGEQLRSVPSELQGTWVGMNDTLRLDDQRMIRLHTEYDSLDNPIETQVLEYPLSDTIQLYKSGDLYVVNMLRRDYGWEILVVEKKPDGTLFWYYPLTEPFFGTGGGLKVDRVERTRYIESADSVITQPVVNRSVKRVEGESINTVYYKGNMKAKKLRMILREDNIYWQLNPDGTIEEEVEF